MPIEVKFDVAQPFEFEGGRTVTIGIEDATMVRVINEEGQEVGRFEFTEIEAEPELGLAASYKLVWAYLDLIDDTYKGKGIGREILKRWKTYTGEVPWTESNDGHRREDGGHLTGDAPGFVARMRNAGLIARDASFEDEAED